MESLRQIADRPDQTASWPDAWRHRAFAAAIFAPAFSLLLVAAWLSPAEQDMGTHTQLGLPPCGFELATNLPCATCGMTTAFSHAADGHLLQALYVQPTGTLLALGTAIITVISAYALVVGLPLKPLMRWLWRPRFALWLGVLVLLGWAYTLTKTIKGW